MKLFSNTLIPVVILFCAAGVFGQDQADKDRAEPKLISAPQPNYPPEAKAAGLGGKITARVKIDETGSVESAEVVSGPATLCSGGDRSLVAAVRTAMIDAIKQAKFQPATRKGVPVKATVFLKSEFKPFADMTTAAPGGVPRIIHAGIINGKALSLPKPAFPAGARAERASGLVSVQVVIGVDGKVLTAQAVDGHPLLHSASIDSACDAKFTPTLLQGNPVKVTGIITYNFRF